MKKIVYFLALFTSISFAATPQTKKPPQEKKDTIRSAKQPPHPHVVKGRKARMRLQLQQIKRHKKQLKEVDSVQREPDKETHKSN